MASVIRGSDNFDSLVHQGIGVNQTWQDVTASRSAGVTYTNTTGKPIMVDISRAMAGGTNVLTVNGLGVSTIGTSSGSVVVTLNHVAIIPDNGTYSINTSGSSSNWFELR